MQLKVDKDKQLKIDEQKMQEFRDRMQSYNYLRQNRVSYWQAIAIVFGTSAVLLLIDLIAKDDVFLKVVFIIGLFIFANWAYRRSISQTQKPIFIAENAVGTIEKEPITIKDKDGKEYSIFSMSDFVYKGEQKK